jgi:hypothetical protein
MADVAPRLPRPTAHPTGPADCMHDQLRPKMPRGTAGLAGSFACILHQMSRLNAALLFQVLLEFRRRLIDAGELQGDF